MSEPESQPAVRDFVIAGAASQLLTAVANYAYAMSTGVLKLEPDAFVVLTVALAGMGMLVGYIFPRIERFIPARSQFTRGVVWFLVVSWWFSLFSRSRRSPSSLIFGTAVALVMGLFFVWLARRRAKARSKT